MVLYTEFLSKVAVQADADAVGFTDGPIAPPIWTFNPLMSSIHINLKRRMTHIEPAARGKALQISGQFRCFRDLRAIHQYGNYRDVALQCCCNLNTDEIIFIVEPTIAVSTPGIEPMLADHCK